MDEGVEILGYDVVTLYPSLKLEFMIREIDRSMVMRIETMKGTEKVNPISLCNVTIPLIIFMLSHSRASVL